MFYVSCEFLLIPDAGLIQSCFLKGNAAVLPLDRTLTAYRDYVTSSHIPAAPLQASQTSYGEDMIEIFYFLFQEPTRLFVVFSIIFRL